MWTPITRTDELPQIGTRETAELDFKAEYGSDTFEIAKDIAAFANASGGTILVGAVGGDILVTYKPLNTDGAKRCSRAVEEAVRDRCRPVPLHSVEQIPLDGGIIVAVNIWPMPGQLVGVRIQKRELKCGISASQPEDVFFFPLRVGTHTKGVMPEQIAMFLDARIRRVAIGLERAVGQRAVLVSVRIRNSNDVHFATATVKSVDMLDNVVEFILDSKSGQADVAVPLDSVASVCRSTKGWLVYLEGRFKEMRWLIDNPDELRALDPFFDPLG